MKDSFVKQIGSDNLAAEVVRHWNICPSALSHVQSSENIVYRFRMGNPERWYFLRFTHNEHRNYEQVLAELEFVLYLSQPGCHVSCPVPSLEGNLLELVVQNKTQLYACVFEAAPGERANTDFTAWDQTLFQQWGRSLGVIHAQSKSFQPAGIRRLRWDQDDVLLNAQKYLPIQEIAARKELERVQSWLENLPENADQFGLIHGDLCCANFHYDGQHITAFDFDDSAYHWFVYDLVCALAPMVFHPNRRLYRQWVVEGYEQVHPLSKAWEEEFDWFLRLRGLYLFILNLRDWEGPMAEHPKRDFLDVLRHSFKHPPRW